MVCVDRNEGQLTLSVVADELGVIRQTVYRYFRNTEDLYAAVGRYAVSSFLDELGQRLSKFTDPAQWVVEALATTIDTLPTRPYLTLLLTTGNVDPFAKAVNSPTSVAFGREIFSRAPFDWSTHGLDKKEIDELIELMLRILQSMVLNPPDPPRSPKALRRYLDRWLAPALR